MNKKVMKVITIAITALCIIMITTMSFAKVTTSDITGNAAINDNQLKTAGNQIATIIRTVGIILSVIILMILGIKYMMGSAEEKAEYKKTMIPYIVGAVILFGASALAGVVVQLAEGITGGSGV